MLFYLLAIHSLEHIQQNWITYLIFQSYKVGTFAVALCADNAFNTWEPGALGMITWAMQVLPGLLAVDTCQSAQDIEVPGLPGGRDHILENRAAVWITVVH